VFGFKLKLSHLATQRVEDPAAFLSRLHAEGCRLVHLERRDRLRQALSSIVARQRLAFHQTRGGRQLRSGPFRIDAQWLIQRMRRMDAHLEGERAALVGLPHLRLCYEDDLLRAETLQATLDRVFDFVGISRAPVTTQYQRTGKDRLTDLVANLDEIQRVLRTTEYAASVGELA
jgi:LPS sulfotransferase NodH